MYFLTVGYLILRNKQNFRYTMNNLSGINVIYNFISCHLKTENVFIILTSKLYERIINMFFA